MLADDHVLMREGIRQLLEFDGTISVIGQGTTINIKIPLDLHFS